MQNSSSPIQALDKILTAHRNGLCDKMKTVKLVGQLYRALPAADATELRKSLVHLFQSSDLTSTSSGAYVVNEAALAISCLGEFESPQQLQEIVFDRFPPTDFVRMDAWARDIVPELQWSLMRYPEKFDADALNHLKEFAAKVRSSKAYSPNTLPALGTLERVAEGIEFDKFVKSLAGGTLETQGISLEQELRAVSHGLSAIVDNALEKAVRLLRAQEEFDPKMAGDLIRSAMDQAHREIVAALEGISGELYDGGEKDGARRQYMRSVDFITVPEEEFFSAIYSLISREATHKLIAERETVLLLHQTVSNYLRLLTKRLNKLRTGETGLLGG